jgi:hypothetical protein
MSKITNKLKEKLKGTKDKVKSTTKEGASTTKEKMTDAKDKVKSSTTTGIGGSGAGDVSSSSSSSKQGRKAEEGAAGTEIGRKEEDPLTQYRSKEPMTPAKIKEHEPTAVKRDMTEKITEPGKEVVPNPEAAKERARRSGMAKGTAGASDTGNEYEQGAAGSNK